MKAHRGVKSVLGELKVTKPKRMPAVKFPGSRKMAPVTMLSLKAKKVRGR